MTLFPPTFGPEPLTPLGFLIRSRAVYARRVALLEGDSSMTYAELAERCHRLAGALVSMGIEPGDRVSVLSPNTGICLEAHFGVPLAGAVLNALNTRLSALELGYIVNHAGSRVLLVHDSLRDLAHHLVTACEAPVRMVVGGSGRVDDEYERMLAGALPASVAVADEWSLLSLNYTSGTTGQPKGVMYAHRGAYLQSLAMAAQAGLDASSVFLWTLPMFHCNGW